MPVRLQEGKRGLDSAVNMKLGAPSTMVSPRAMGSNDNSNKTQSTPFLRDVARARTAFATLNNTISNPQGRALTAEEVRLLEGQGNWATDWSVVRLSSGEGGHLAVDRVRGNCFHGPVILGNLSGQICLPGAEHSPQPCGVYGSTLSWCIIGDGALVKGCNAISRCLVGPRAAVVGCGVISCSQAPGTDGGGSGGGGATNRFANGLVVAVGPETKGREVACYATMSLSEAAVAATDRAHPETVRERRAAAEEYGKLASCGATVIGEGARVMSASKVVDVYLGEGGTIESSEVENATVLSSFQEPSGISGGCVVRSALIQEGVTVNRGSNVHKSVLMEHSHVDNNGQLTESILGPDSGVASGECLHSLVGPFVGFHHQALLIATIWPLGRGNVGYGANVGSNHTSRQADQEMWPGEGVFFGLSTVIKFPGNYSESPFSVIGAGTTCLPQRVAFPFSLINTSEHAGLEDVSPGLNHLRPGWVLAESMYMVIRNEEKYASRKKARRNRVDWAVFRLSIMRLMADARARLVAAGVADKRAVYIGDRAIPGLGKNYMTEQSRIDGIAAYTLHLHRYALRGLLARLDAGLPVHGFPLVGDQRQHDKDSNVKDSLSNGSTASAASATATPARMSPPSASVLETARLLTLSDPQSSGFNSNEARDDGGSWGFQKFILVSEFEQGERSLDSLMGRLITIERQVAEGVETSKARDDQRGAQVVPGYADTHTPASEEKAVKRAYSLQKETEKKAHAVMSRL